MTFKPYEHKVQYYETDQMSIVHHSNYIRWLEEARCDVLEQLGTSCAYLESIGIIIPVLAVSCEYKTMTHFGETVRIFAQMTEYDSIRMKMEYKIEDKETGELRSIGTSRHCFLHNGRPISLRRKYAEVDQLFKSCLPDSNGQTAHEADR